MEDQKAKQMISTDHQFVSHQPRKKKKDIQFQNYSLKELENTGRKKIPELNTSKWMKNVLKVSKHQPCCFPWEVVNREKLYHK